MTVASLKFCMEYWIMDDCDPLNNCGLVLDHADTLREAIKIAKRRQRCVVIEVLQTKKGNVRKKIVYRPCTK